MPRALSPITVALFGVTLLIVALRIIFPGALVALLTPVSNLSNLAATTASNVTASFKNPVELQQELDAANVNNAVLIEQNAALIAKTQDLEALLGDRVAPPPSILASVVARPPMSPYDTLLIDQGSIARVQVGAQVLGPLGTPIGTIASVTPHSARVVLYSSPDVSSVAWVGEERLGITLLGMGGGAFYATAPNDAPLAEGDAVYMSSEGAVRIGTITRIDGDPSTPSVTLRIQPVVNFYSLTWVSVSAMVL